MSGVSTSKPAMSLAASPMLVDVSVSANVLGPDVASVTIKAMSRGTSWWLGGHSVDGVGTHVTVGGVASRLTVTVTGAVPPTLIAVHVSVVPSVSKSIVVAPQPCVCEIADSASVTSHVTVTSPVYQPSFPFGPSKCGTIVGAVGLPTSFQASLNWAPSTVPSHHSPQAPLGSADDFWIASASRSSIATRICVEAVESLPVAQQVGRHVQRIGRENETSVRDAVAGVQAAHEVAELLSSLDVPQHLDAQGLTRGLADLVDRPRVAGGVVAGLRHQLPDVNAGRVPVAVVARVLRPRF